MRKLLRDSSTGTISFFHKVMKKTMVTANTRADYQMEFPLQFLKHHGQEFDGSATLEMAPDGGRQWPLAVTYKGSHHVPLGFLRQCVSNTPIAWVLREQKQDWSKNGVVKLKTREYMHASHASRVRLEVGWKEFAMANELQVGDQLLSELSGPSCFEVERMDP